MKKEYRVMLLLVLTCFGCHRGEKDSLAGTWYGETNDLSYSMVLHEDGTGAMDVGGISFILTYETQRNPDVIILEVDGDIYLSRYVFSNKGKKLTLIGLFVAGRDVTFDKIKNDSGA
jgi:hypothetical protein